MAYYHEYTLSYKNGFSWTLGFHFLYLIIEFIDDLLTTAIAIIAYALLDFIDAMAIGITLLLAKISVRKCVIRP